MKTKDLITVVNSHIDKRLKELGQDNDDELRDQIRSGIATMVVKEVTPDYVVRVARRMLAARLAKLRPPEGGGENAEGAGANSARMDEQR